MKKIILLAAVSFFSVASFAGISLTPDDQKYCAKMKDGILVVMHNGVKLNAPATLADGSQIQPDGTIILQNGTKKTLKEGECVADGAKVDDKLKEKSEKEYNEAAPSKEHNEATPAKEHNEAIPDREDK